MAGILKCDQVQSDSNLAFAIAGSNVAFMNATSLQMVGSNVSLAGTNVITNGKVVSSAQPTGAILQVVMGTYATSTSTTSGSQVDTGLSATITPTSASSKILVLTSCRIFAQPSTPASVVLLRNATNLQQRYRYGLTDTAAGSGDQFSTAYLDSPATTSATTYKVTFSRQSGSGTIYAQLDNDMSTMTLMEIAG